MHHLLFWITVGIIAGVLAKSVVPSEGAGGLMGDLVVGIIGAFIGGALFTAFLGYSYGGWVGSTGVAFVGAVVFLAILRSVSFSRQSKYAD